LQQEDRVFASPNTPITTYFGCARRLVREAYATEDSRTNKESVALALLVSVAAVEAFLNVWFRTFVEREEYKKHRERILRDIRLRSGLSEKIKEWPKLFFGKGFDLSRGAGQRFLTLIDRRNALMHVTTECNVVEIPGITIHDTVDVTEYENLTPEDALAAVETCEDLLREFFLLGGYGPEGVLHQMHLWTGRVPMPQEIEETRRNASKDVNRT